MTDTAKTPVMFDYDMAIWTLLHQKENPFCAAFMSTLNDYYARNICHIADWCGGRLTVQEMADEVEMPADVQMAVSLNCNMAGVHQIAKTLESIGKIHIYTGDLEDAILDEIDTDDIDDFDDFDDGPHEFYEPVDLTLLFKH